MFLWHLLLVLRLVDDADDSLEGCLGLLPVGWRGQKWEPRVPVVPGGHHHQGAAVCQAPKPEMTRLI